MKRELMLLFMTAGGTLFTSERSEITSRGLLTPTVFPNYMDIDYVRVYQ